MSTSQDVIQRMALLMVCAAHLLGGHLGARGCARALRRPCRALVGQAAHQVQQALLFSLCLKTSTGILRTHHILISTHVNIGL